MPEADRRKDAQALCVEIFEMTGQKLTLEDPIVVAALIQSALVRRAATDAASELQATVRGAAAELIGAAGVKRERMARLDSEIAKAITGISDAAKKVGESELASLQAQFARSATATLDLVRRDASQTAPRDRWWKFAAVLLCGTSAGMLIGFGLIKTTASKITGEQMRLMVNGTLLDTAWSKLPKASRDLIEASGRPDNKPIGEAGKTDKERK